MHLLAVIIRFLWSLTIGLVFFSIGLIVFLLLDILKPNSDHGYRALISMYKIGSLGAFKGLRMEKDDFDVNVEKKRGAR